MSKKILREYIKTMSDREIMIWIFGLVLVSSGHWLIAILWVTLGLEELVKEEDKKEDNNEDL